MTMRQTGARTISAAWRQIGLGLGLGLGLLVATTGTASADRDTVTERSRLEVAPGGKPIKTITIENPLGDVKVEGHDGSSILIETRKTAPDDEALDRLRVSLVPNPDGTVRITTTADSGKEVKPVVRSAVRIDLIVRAPRDARVEAAVSSGRLEVINMDAGGLFDTASGPIWVKNVSGGVSTNSLSGTTSLTQVFGSVDAQTVSSDVNLDTIGGERLIASAASRGSIAGRRVRSREIELTTVDGKIVLEGEASLRGRVVVATLKGDIDVKLRRQGPLTVRGRGSKVQLGGSAPAPQADAWVEVHFGRDAMKPSGALVEMRSRLGDVRFTLAD